ncbi:MAG: hypothetical protein IT372_36245 [Polyangiaceae bacterium]|nr:hypothetical protein [Polyangiaceae bacterium]
MSRLAPWIPAALAAAAAASCATLPEDGGGDEHLPNAKAGPFRVIAQDELGNSRAAPYVFDDDEAFTRDLSVVDLDGDPSTRAVAGYFAAQLAPAGQTAEPGAPPNAIVRHDAADGRSFDRSDVTVLEPQEPWEGGTVGAPSAVRVGAEIWLYYAAAGGIGLARSPDGLAFTREPDPVLAPEGGGWEGGAVPGSPGVLALPDGSLRMFYEIAGPDGSTSIGEARSADGLAWERAGAAPALEPSTAPDAYDAAGAGDPAPVLGTSATGRTALRLYYAARDRAGRTTIAMAARFSDEGPFERAVSPVFGAASTLGPRSPCVVVYPDLSLLFATQRAGKSDAQDYPAVVAGVAPADAHLPPPDPP